MLLTKILHTKLGSFGRDDKLSAVGLLPTQFRYDYAVFRVTGLGLCIPKAGEIYIIISILNGDSISRNNTPEMIGHDGAWRGAASIADGSDRDRNRVTEPFS